jgi:hypothetical protein
MWKLDILVIVLEYTGAFNLVSCFPGGYCIIYNLSIQSYKISSKILPRPPSTLEFLRLERILEGRSRRPAG